MHVRSFQGQQGFFYEIVFVVSMTTTADHRRGPNIWFYRTGLGDKNGTDEHGWRMLTLPSIIHLLNDTGVRDNYRFHRNNDCNSLVPW